MKIVILLIICAIGFNTYSFSQVTNQMKSARELIERVTKRDNLPIKLKITKKSDNTYYDYSVDDGVLAIEASSGVALVRGFYDYAKSNGFGIYSWSGSNLQLPEELNDSNNKRVVSPVKHHYMSNVVVYGYSKPYWDWERWESEIDWMALHGVDMPLALVGFEAILARVWKKMGLTDDEINSYFVGPAHLPWMRMGNASGIDGPLNQDWYDSQIELQHKILERMSSLGMKPICPGFAGFVPEAFKRLYPDVDIVKTNWAGAFYNWMISPESELFTKIGTAFIKEWEKEFGKCDYYLVDSFNEMEIPFPPKESAERYELLASYGETVYNSIKRGNPKATWVMQGWMFGYQRYIWDYNTLEALVSKVPDDKMLLLDLAVDYNKHFWHSEVNWDYYKGFYGKQWVYSVIPNMGGKCGMTGVLEFYANGHHEALKSENRGDLVAIGMAPEGIENNEVIYELFSDASWSDKEIDLTEWLREYSINRYGATNVDLERYWELMTKSVYGSFTDHPRYNWQMRPGRVAKGSINANDNYFAAIESFVKSASLFRNNHLYIADLRELVALYIGGKVEQLIQVIEWYYHIGELEVAQKLEQKFETLMLGMDIILDGHPNLRLDRWLDFARGNAKNSEQEAQYVMNAKRIVTIWGPPIDDYSARVWSGLIRDYYLPRWRHYFSSKRTGVSFNFAKWEREWVESSEPLSKVEQPEDIVDFVHSLILEASDISLDVINQNPNLLRIVTLKPRENVEQEVAVSSQKLRDMKGIIFNGGMKGVVIRSVRIEADGVNIYSNSQPCQFNDKTVSYDIAIPKEVNANNGARLIVEFYNGGDTSVQIGVGLL